MPAEAVAQLEKAAALPPEPNTMASLAHAYAISGQKEKAPKIPTQLEEWYWIKPISLSLAMCSNHALSITDCAAGERVGK